MSFACIMILLLLLGSGFWWEARFSSQPGETTVAPQGRTGFAAFSALDWIRRLVCEGTSSPISLDGRSEIAGVSEFTSFEAFSVESI